MGDGPKMSFELRVIRLIAFGALLVGCATIVHADDRSPQIVVPKSGGAGGYVRDMTPVDVSLWEYFAHGKYATTGKQITFRFPKAYLTNSTNQTGGPQAFIDIQFDRHNGAPWLVGGAGETLPAMDRASVIARLARQIELQISYEHGPSGPYSPIVIKSQPVPHIALGGGDPKVRMAGGHCGFQLFDTSRDWGTVRDPQGTLVDLKTTQAPPFDRARYFVRQSASGKYTLLVRCTPSPAGNNPRCATGTDFEGWQLTIWFSGEHLCQVDDVIRQSRVFLDRFVVERGRSKP